MSRSAEKNWKGDSLVSPGMVCYAEKQVKPFWFSSLDQIVQFDTIIFCRTFKNYFGQFVWIEKKVTIIVAFHFMKRRLKRVTIIVAFHFMKRRLKMKYRLWSIRRKRWFSTHDMCRWVKAKTVEMNAFRYYTIVSKYKYEIIYKL